MHCEIKSEIQILPYSIKRICCLWQLVAVAKLNLRVKLRTQTAGDPVLMDRKSTAPGRPRLTRLARLELTQFLELANSEF